MAFVGSSKQDSVVKALDFTGQKLKGVPIILQLTESEKNRAVKAADGIPMNANNTPFHRLKKLKGVAVRAKDRHLQQFFKVIGNVANATIVTDRLSGRSKGVGYVEFAKQDSVVKALHLAGQKLKGTESVLHDLFKPFGDGWREELNPYTSVESD
ncbi:hypothetical protein P154DRAFT_570465 [Amniculicola lignicola CBS 123094]|uniref:RRM domain-containing protein n=1 Tax=Amniculicola lignicola CBS 123094 TaxID=1392246 RepID=A0A6A5X010_9PLEO|nr:hypothetical protein P154DRAFT_570465 [Amniculicola lignicola CBS 123094]